MRIQHNVTAMNAYRNYNNNTSALSKNLEKLSSGYKINRAGDDAAGLAISEKMRAQISGLNAATKNVKDGISLVKTAEGAMQEVQDMLNRMSYLATQSANGTYDNEVDRLNLQKEVTALQTEIDRIADSSNFNGIKLMDGSLSEAKVDVSAVTMGTATGMGDVTVNPATGTETGITIGVGADGVAHKATIEYADASGKLKSVTIDYLSANQANNNATAIRDAIAQNAELSAIFDVGGVDDAITLTSKVTGEGGSKVLRVTTTDATSTAIGGIDITEGENPSVTVGGAWDNPVAGNTITISGKTYELVADAATAPTKDGAIAVLVGGTAGATLANLNKALANNGIEAVAAGTNLTFSSIKNGTGLTLQIGDTADEYNQMKVSVGDMHSLALGIADVDISSQEGAAAAVQKIKDAINSVSSTRGDLGAIQNRLEHTQNNLSVMAENITDAESNIRDTDVADEMMAYTKNNILIQSAQAMLAQANQIPQGVLQLLQ